jgi:hypothetical protein
MRLLLPVIGRALAVVLLLTTVLLPAADHHAIARLAGVQPSGQDAHWLLMHHHAHGPTAHASAPVESGLPAAAPSLGALESAPAIAPTAVLAAAGTPGDALGLGAPVADLLPLALALGLLFWRLDRGGARGPRSPAPAVPLPPPRPLLAAAA